MFFELDEDGSGELSMEEIAARLVAKPLRRLPVSQSPGMSSILKPVALSSAGNASSIRQQSASRAYSASPFVFLVCPPNPAA